MKIDTKFDINYIDPSGISTFNRCPFKWMCSRQLGLRKPDKSTIALDYGTAMHAALPLAYDDVGEAIRRFSEVWDEFGHGEIDDKRNTTRAIASLHEFNANNSPSVCPYTREEFPIQAEVASHVDKGELPFVIDIGAEYLFAGRIDYPVRLKASGKLWSLDFKTSAEISARFFNNFHRSPQACGYSVALSTLSGEPVQGMIVEAIRSSKTNTETQMNPTFVSDVHVEKFLELAKRTAVNIKYCNEEQDWPTQTCSCSPYPTFGMPGYQCEYSTLCDLPDWRDGLKFYTQGKPFHPFSGLE